jgi:predicted phage-related endonuclease
VLFKVRRDSMWEGGEGHPPEHYQWQVQHQLMVTSARWPTSTYSTAWRACYSK